MGEIYKVFLYNPIKDKLTRACVFIPTHWPCKIFNAIKKFYGGAKLEKNKYVSQSQLIDSDFPARKKYLLFRATILPEDNINTMRKIIAGALQTEIYKLHIFENAPRSAWDSSASHAPFYNIRIDKSYVDVNIREIRNVQDKVMDVPIDMYMYENRENVFVSNKEFYSICPTKLYCARFDSIFSHYNVRLDNTKDSEGIIDIMWNGFIIKYWPMFPKFLFKNYVLNEVPTDELQILEIPDNEAESKLIDQILVTRNVDMAITILRMEVTNHETTNNIDTLDIFNEVKINNNIIMSKTKLGRYSIYKYKKSLGEIKHLQISPEPEAVEFIYGEDKAVVQIHNNGEIVISAEYGIVDNMLYDDVVARLKTYIDYLKKSLNNNIEITRDMFFYQPALPVFPPTNIDYLIQKIGGIKHKQFISWVQYLAQFPFVSLEMDKFNNANLYLSRAINRFDPDAFSRSIKKIENREKELYQNEFSYLYDAGIAKYHNRYYGGRRMVIKHLVNSIDIYVFNTDNTEIEFIKKFISFAFANMKLSKEKVVVSLDTKKVGKRLAAQDPKLFKPNKIDPSYTQYSVLCQSGHQPLGFTEEQTKLLDAKIRAKLVKYVNMTTGDPAYYYCPYKKYPVVGFRVGVHPYNYCIPCCKSAERQEILNSCMQTGSYEKGQRIDKNRLLNFAKVKTEGAKVRLPEELETALSVSIAQYITSDRNMRFYSLAEQFFADKKFQAIQNDTAIIAIIDKYHVDEKTEMRFIDIFLAQTQILIINARFEDGKLKIQIPTRHKYSDFKQIIIILESTGKYYLVGPILPDILALLAGPVNTTDSREGKYLLDHNGIAFGKLVKPEQVLSGGFIYLPICPIRLRNIETTKIPKLTDLCAYETLLEYLRTNDIEYQIDKYISLKGKTIGFIDRARNLRYMFYPMEAKSDSIEYKYDIFEVISAAISAQPNYSSFDQNFVQNVDSCSRKIHLYNTVKQYIAIESQKHISRVRKTITKLAEEDFSNFKIPKVSLYDKEKLIAHRRIARTQEEFFAIFNKFIYEFDTNIRRDIIEGKDVREYLDNVVTIISDTPTESTLPDNSLAGTIVIKNNKVLMTQKEYEEIMKILKDDLSNPIRINEKLSDKLSEYVIKHAPGEEIKIKKYKKTYRYT